MCVDVMVMHMMSLHVFAYNCVGVRACISAYDCACGRPWLFYPLYFYKVFNYDRTFLKVLNSHHYLNVCFVFIYIFRIESVTSCRLTDYWRVCVEKGGWGKREMKGDNWNFGYLKMRVINYNTSIKILRFI